MIGVPNAKYLAFGTPDENALTRAFTVRHLKILAFGNSKTILSILTTPLIIHYTTKILYFSPLH